MPYIYFVLIHDFENSSFIRIVSLWLHFWNYLILVDKSKSHWIHRKAHLLINFPLRCSTALNLNKYKCFWTGFFYFFLNVRKNPKVLYIFEYYPPPSTTFFQITKTTFNLAGGGEFFYQKSAVKIFWGKIL